MDFRTALILALTLGVVASQKKGSLKFNDDKFKVDWTLAEDKKSVLFSVTAESPGWIGVGFSADGTMRNADLIIGLVTSDTTLDVKDYWAVTMEPPTLDTNQGGTTVISATRDNTAGTNHMEFKREVNTGDATQDLVLPLTGEGLHIVWAYSNSRTLEQHTGRGKSEKKVIFDGDDLPTTTTATTTTDSGVSGIHGISLLIPAIVIFQLYSSYA